MAEPNIIVFGETGAGKSSIINMLSSDEHTADISSGADGRTFQSKAYPVSIQGSEMLLWDTSGLNESDQGSVTNTNAILQLYRLLRDLKAGVNLLVFVIRAPRINRTTSMNWKLFHEIICQKEVPSVIVITGLEAEDDMDQWWIDNVKIFHANKIYPSGVACITASRGKKLKKGSGKHTYDDEYEESREKMIRLLCSTYLRSPWKVPAVQWLKKIVTSSYEDRFLGLCLPKETIRNEFRLSKSYLKLVDCGLQEKDIEELTNMLN